MTIEFTVSAVIPASPGAIYDPWLDSDGHMKMTGSPAHVGGEARRFLRCVGRLHQRQRS